MNGMFQGEGSLASSQQGSSGIMSKPVKEESKPEKTPVSFNFQGEGGEDNNSDNTYSGTVVTNKEVDDVIAEYKLPPVLTSYNNTVKDLQTYLNATPVAPGLSTDGRWGAKTSAAVSDFQRYKDELYKTTAAETFDETGGIVSRPATANYMQDINKPLGGGDVVFIKSFVDLMGESEGTADHQASEGQFTYAYGILPATANNLKIDPVNYTNRKQFAEAVYSKMYKNAKTTYTNVYKGMTDSEKKATLSLNINLGRLPDGVVTALNGEVKDFNAAGDTLKAFIHFEAKKTGKGMVKGVNYASKGLSKRRAAEFNIFMKGQPGFSRVTRVEVEGTKAAPTFVWKDAQGNEVKRFSSSKTLSPDNSMTAVTL